jgi:hypothetical protein
VGTGIKDVSSLFSDIDFAGTALPAICGSATITLAAIKFMPSLAGAFFLVPFSDVAGPK